MIWVAKGVTHQFARQVVRLATDQGARAVCRIVNSAVADIWVRESDRDITYRIVMSFWNDGRGD
jgi:hypothetical protein